MKRLSITAALLAFAVLSASSFAQTQPQPPATAPAIPPPFTSPAAVYSGISGPGRPVTGTGAGGWRSNQEILRYDGPDSKPGWQPLGQFADTSAAVKQGLLPPIKPLWELHLRDTVICVGPDKQYYMTGSSGDNIWDRNDGIEIWRSPDLQHWDYLGLVWSFEKDGTWQKKWGTLHEHTVRDIWAPELHYLPIHKKWVLMYSLAGGGGCGIAVSSSGKPEGPYVNPLKADTRLLGGIDPTLFEDDDGKIYVTAGRGGSIGQLNDDLSDWAVPMKPVKVDKSDARAADVSKNVPADLLAKTEVAMEGASLFKRNGKYYLGGAVFWNGSGAGRYDSVVAIADNIWGPYTHWHEAVPCGGGTNYFQDNDGRWFCCFFGNDQQAPFREKPAIVQIDFDKEGRIRVADDQPAFILQPGANTHWRSAAPAAAPPPATAPAAAPTLLDIRSFGAVGDGTTLNTKALQSAIDQATANGGGTVLIAGGNFVTGTLYLKSNVTLHIEAGAALLGSPHIADYTTDTDRTMYAGEPHMDRCLIFAKDAANICIDGMGTIDGQGKSFPEKGDPQKNRPKLIRFLNCSRIRMRDVTLQHPASWTNEWRYCSDIVVDGITVSSRGYTNGDGLDLDGCTRARISNSTFDTGDDAICLQTSATDHPCTDIAVMNCNFSSRWAGMRIGLLSRGDFSNIAVTNCTFTDHQDSGLKIQMNEGAAMSNMIFSNLVMKNVPRPVFLTFCQKNAWVDAGPDLPPMKSVSDLQFSNIVVDDSAITGPAAVTCGFQITGMPDHPIQNLSFSDIHATFPGGGSAKDATDTLAEFTPQILRAGWPEYSRFGATVPSFGFYARHVNGLSLRNIHFTTFSPDARPAILFVDVKNQSTTDTPQPATQPVP